MFYQLLFFILASAGVTFIITYSVIFERIRYGIERRSDFLGELIGCPMCSGFWTGMTMSLISFPGYNPIYAGAITSFVCWIVAISANYINTIAEAMADTTEEVEDE